MKVIIRFCALMLLTAPVLFMTGCCSKKVSLEEANKAYQSGDFARAAEIFSPAAEKGDPEAQVNMAFMYYCGMHVEKNHKLAADWYLKAARQNNSNAQFSLGTMYENGEGVARSL